MRKVIIVVCVYDVVNDGVFKSLCFCWICLYDSVLFKIWWGWYLNLFIGLRVSLKGLVC